LSFRRLSVLILAFISPIASAQQKESNGTRSSHKNRLILSRTRR
jgi:hypothetical protein